MLLRLNNQINKVRFKIYNHREETVDLQKVILKTIHLSEILIIKHNQFKNKITSIFLNFRHKKQHKKKSQQFKTSIY